MERKETIEVIKKNWPDSFTMLREALETLIPELKESEDEDEKIRNEIIAFVEQAIHRGGGTPIPEEQEAKWITWLEKQGDKPKKVSIWKHWKNGIAGNGEGKQIYLIKIGNTYNLSSCLSFECDYIELSELDNLMLEKQGKQNMIPLDKVIKFLDEQLINDKDEVTGESFINFQNYGAFKETFISYFKRKMLEKQGEPVEINPTEFDTRLQALIGEFDGLPKEELIGSLSFWLNVVQNDGTYEDKKSKCKQKLVEKYNIKDIGSKNAQGKLGEMIKNLKSADKVEPKFHEGEWIICCDYEPVQIINIRTNVYAYEMSNGDIRPFWMVDNNNNIRHWTIQDAKPGDVLVYKGNIKYSNGIKYKRICLFNNLGNAFFTLTKFPNCVEDYGIDVNIDYPDNTVPATKEQKELLFMAMKYAGYKFDFEKKELKKIEQKLTDKVEPKFKVGDYVVGKYISGYISEVRDDCYLLGYQGFSIDKQDKYHLWTIEDAKDGDILAVEPIYVYHSSPFIAIYKERGFDYFNSYCFIGFDGKFYTGDTGHDITGIHPATKEQRDLLFQKMHEAGYEWNAKKKELKKIEQKPIEWHREDEQNLNACLGYIPDEFLRRWLTDAIHAKYDKPAEWTHKDGKNLAELWEILSVHRNTNPQVDNLMEWVKDLVSYKRQEWSEEDKDMISTIISDLKRHGGDTMYSAEVDWLKQFQPKQEWSEEDKEYLSSALRMIEHCGFNAIGELSKGAVIDWLKSLKDRVLPQPKQEWSEEDENAIQVLKNIVKHSNEIDENIYITPLKEKLYNWLKSLRPQKQWKPSEEQMEALKASYLYWKGMIKEVPYTEGLESLYEQLKKLREG